MGQTYQIGDHLVETIDRGAGAVATLGTPAGCGRGEAARYPIGFLQGVRRLGGIWIGNRVAFRGDPGIGAAVVDLFRTHFGMAAESTDPLPAPPPSGLLNRPDLAATLIPSTAPEIDRLRSNLPILEQRARVLRQRLAAADRAVEVVRRRIAEIDATASTARSVPAPSSPGPT